MSKIVPKCRNVFWGDFFEKNFLPSVPWSHRKFSQENQRKFKIAEKPRIVPKIVQTCFEHVLWHFFRKKMPRVPWRVGFRKISKKNQKIFKIPNWPNSSSKVSKRVLNMFWCDFSEFFCQVFHAGLFRFSGLKNMRSVFWTWKIWIRFSGLKICGRYIEQIQEKKSEKSSKFLNCPNRSQVSKRVLGLFLDRKVFSHCSMEGRAFENFQKSRKNFKFQNMPLMVSQSVPTCFEQTLGRCFWNFFRPVFHAVHFRFSGLKIKSSDSRN